MKDYSLALTTGVDIPIQSIKTAIHQPSIREISLLGCEEKFFLALQLLTLDKNAILPSKSLADSISDFDAFITLLNGKNEKDAKESIILLLTLLFPNYMAVFFPNSINFFGKTKNENGEIDSFLIDSNNFVEIRDIIKDMFRVDKILSGDKAVYNPKGQKAEDIVNKIMRGREKIKQQKGASKEGIFDTYISILVVGLQLNWLDLVDYTVFQLFRTMDRYNLYIDWDIVLRSKLAGAQNVRNAENWMKELD